jgi:hypothetical protein
MDKNKIFSETLFFIPEMKAEVKTGERGICETLGISSFAIITGHNPKSIKRNSLYNWIADLTLYLYLYLSGYSPKKSEGRSADGGHREKSWFVADISIDRAREIGGLWGQDSIFWGQTGRAAEIVWCPPSA